MLFFIGQLRFYTLLIIHSQPYALKCNRIYNLILENRLNTISYHIYIQIYIFTRCNKFNCFRFNHFVHFTSFHFVDMLLSFLLLTVNEKKSKKNNKLLENKSTYLSMVLKKMIKNAWFHSSILMKFNGYRFEVRKEEVNSSNVSKYKMNNESK